MLVCCLLVDIFLIDFLMALKWHFLVDRKKQRLIEDDPELCDSTPSPW